MALHDLDHLRTFLTVQRAGSLTEAAALLGISQPTVSAHVQALEASLGYPVLVRDRSGATVTTKGAALAREVAVHIDALDDIASLSADAAGTPRAVHLGGPAELLTTVVLPRLPELLEAAGVPVHVTFGLAEPLLEALRTGALDVVVSAVQPRVRGVEAAPLIDEEFVLVAAPAWAPPVGTEAPASLAHIPVVTYATNLPIVRRYWRTEFDRRPDGVMISAVIPDLRGVLAAVIAGTGMSVLPRYLAQDALDSGALVLLHEPTIAPLNTVYLARRIGEANRQGPVRALSAALERVVG
ncbi:LysR family transcriptional regulator [Plantibacter sp. YIM 135347]|uniref:LysR family transcriptional regulator n=1 Tax=Plantibacter sp. YIM 135347 TaxID=3423919 RepID=UPI003D3553A9